MKLIQFRAMLRFMELSPKEANINLIYFDLLGEIKAGGMLETKISEHVPVQISNPLERNFGTQFWIKRKELDPAITKTMLKEFFMKHFVDNRYMI